MARHAVALDERDLTYEAGMQAMEDLKLQCPNDTYLFGDIDFVVRRLHHGRELGDVARVLREEIIPQAIGEQLIALQAFYDELVSTLAVA